MPETTICMLSTEMHSKYENIHRSKRNDGKMSDTIGGHSKSEVDALILDEMDVKQLILPKKNIT